MKSKDVLIEEDITGRVDIAINNGDIAIGDCTLQNVGLILISQRGEWKQYPALGIGIDQITGDEDKRYWSREIRENLKSDRLNIERLKIDFNKGIIDINARYE